MEKGEFVICINDTFNKVTSNNTYSKIKLPKFGKLYKVRDYKSGTITLNEIVNPHFTFKDGEAEPRFDVNRFVSLDKIKKENPELIIITDKNLK